MDVQAQTIGSAPLASEREEHFADTAPVSPRKLQNNARGAERANAECLSFAENRS